MRKRDERMRESDFRDYTYYSIETDDDGSRYVHIMGTVWKNDGREHPTEEDEYGNPIEAPYTVTEYTGVYIPLDEIIADRDVDGESIIWEYIDNCQQYEGDYTWEELLDEGYGDPGYRNGVISTGHVPDFSSHLYLGEIWYDTPDGDYHS